MSDSQPAERGVEAGVVQSGGETVIVLLYFSIPRRRPLSWPDFTYESYAVERKVPKGHSKCVGQILNVSSVLSLSDMQPALCITSQRGGNIYTVYEQNLSMKAENLLMARK